MAMYEKQLVLGVAVDPEPSAATSSDELGEVFTRRWVVDLILDLVGYTEDRDLGEMVALEPACGEGAFLGPIVERLIASCTKHARNLADVANAVRAFDLSEFNVERARKLTVTRLVDAGLNVSSADSLAKRWVRQGDFLLKDDALQADFVLGNPPYIGSRTCLRPAARLTERRARQCAGAATSTSGSSSEDSAF